MSGRAATSGGQLLCQLPPPMNDSYPACTRCAPSQHLSLQHRQQLRPVLLSSSCWGALPVCSLSSAASRRQPNSPSDVDPDVLFACPSLPPSLTVCRVAHWPASQCGTEECVEAHTRVDVIIDIQGVREGGREGMGWCTKQCTHSYMLSKCWQAVLGYDSPSKQRSTGPHISPR